ncbi:MAG: nuclear transport factor 2 family protein [Pseudomonadota bacterium]
MNNEHAVLDVAQRFIDALNRDDEDAVRAIYHPEARIWHNFEEGLQSIDQNVKTLHWMHRKLSKLSYDVVRLQALPDGYLQQHVLRGETASGQPVALHACAICKVVDGRITALEEYLDPEQVAVLSTG